jgi:alpha/beta superfamily hydrolase
MVRRLDERMVTIAAPGGALEGVYVPARDPDYRVDHDAGGAVVAAPHPLYGGAMDSPVVNELAHACAQSGFSSLRFNWRGVGASSGIPSGEAADADADFRAALAQLAETVPGPLLACGYSFGAASALRVGRDEERVERLILVAPPPALLPAEPFARLERPLLVLAAAEDEIAPPAELAALVRAAPAGRLEVIPKADHFFLAGLAHVGQLSASWLG